MSEINTKYNPYRRSMAENLKYDPYQKRAPQKSWAKKSKSPLIVTKHTHSWVKLSENTKYCLECKITDILNEIDDDIIDISEYMEDCFGESEAEILKKKIFSVQSTYCFLKNKNPESTIEDLRILLLMHYKQIALENDCLFNYCLKRKKDKLG